MKRTVFICLIALFFIGCTKKSSFRNIENRIVELPPINNTGLKLEKLDIQAMGLVYGHCVDSLFLLKTREFKNSFRVFNTKTFQDYGTLFSGGEGPSEYTNLSTQGQYMTTPDSIMLWTRDNGKRKLRLTNITRSLAEKTTVIDKEYSLKASLYNIYAINDTFFVGDTFDGIKWSYAKFNPATEQITPVFDFLEFKDVSFSSCNSTLKKDMSKIAYAPFFFNQIFFFSPDGDERFSVSFGIPTSLEELEKKQYQDRILYFANIAATQEQVWILYDGCDFTLPNENKPNSRIIIMDWDGNPLHMFDTGKKLNTIFNDSGQNTMYAIDNEENIYRLHIEQ